jgi:putative transposase
MKEKEEFNFEEFKKQAIKGLYEGKPFNGEKGIFAPLLKHFLESALSAEMETHLEESKAIGVENRRNGKALKQVRSLSGEFELESYRDRAGSFEPIVLPKRQVIITEELEDKVIALYGLGMSTRDISKHIKEIYQMELSAAHLSSITDKIIPAMLEWKNRPLQSLYPIVFLDCMHYKVKADGHVSTRAIYNILGIDMQGHKDLLGMYVAESEGAKFWLSVLTDLKKRGVEDILISCIDGLKGFPEAISTVYPQTQIQLCIVHQIRNSLKFIPDKDKRAFVADLKRVYTANSEEEGFSELEALESIWGRKYGVAIKPWFNNWTNLSSFFAYSEDIRRLIYTTNPIEGFHRQVRKVTKTKGAFTSDQALQKLVYLVVRNVSEKWKSAIKNWGATLSQLYVIFEDRIKFHNFGQASLGG